MIGYVTVGTNDFDKAAAFYDKLMAKLGASRLMEEKGRFVVWSKADGSAGFSVLKPYDGKKACIGNGCMTAFQMDSPQKVDALYAYALKLGAIDEGAAGPRGDGFYAGYCRDLDGNKFNFFCSPKS